MNTGSKAPSKKLTLGCLLKEIWYLYFHLHKLLVIHTYLSNEVYCHVTNILKRTNEVGGNLHSNTTTHFNADHDHVK